MNATPKVVEVAASKALRLAMQRWIRAADAERRAREAVLREAGRQLQAIGRREAKEPTRPGRPDGGAA